MARPTVMGLLDLVLPRRCVLCGVPGTDACDRCLAALPRLRPPLCERCGAPTQWPVRRCLECEGRRLAFASARAAVAYETSVRRLVAAWKERGRRRLASSAVALVVDVVPRPAATVITAVPPDRERAYERGHHPAETLAAGLAAIWTIERRSLLRRRRDTPRQVGLPLRERRRNVADAFAATTRVPPCVVLVDDVYTTGSTVAAAASALRAAGARRVDVVTFARAMR